MMHEENKNKNADQFQSMPPPENITSVRTVLDEKRVWEYKLVLGIGIYWDEIYKQSRSAHPSEDIQ